MKRLPERIDSWTQGIVEKVSREAAMSTALQVSTKHNETTLKHLREAGVDMEKMGYGYGAVVDLQSDKSVGGEGKAATDRPAWAGSFVTAYQAREQGRPGDDRILLSYRLLRQLARTDPDTWAIIKKFKTRITKLRWQVVPDLNGEQSQLDLWEQECALWLSPFADPGFEPSFRGTALPAEIAVPLKRAILKIDRSQPDARRRLRWYMDAAAMELKTKYYPSALRVEEQLKHINGDTNDPWDTFIERLIDDVLTYDSHGVVLRPNLGGGLYEAYGLPGDEIVPLLRMDRSRPEPPDPAYIWRHQGQMAAEFVANFDAGRDQNAMLHIVANPQENLTGFSPVEACAYMITATLFADAYNLDIFRHNIPPGIIAVGSGMTDQKLTRLRDTFSGDVMGKIGGRQQLLFMNTDKEKIGVIPLNSLKPSDMDYKEYRRLTLRIKAMCFGLSGLDLGDIEDYKYETSNNQMKISSEGIREMMRMIEEQITVGIIRIGMGESGLRFRFIEDTTILSKDDAVRDQTMIFSGRKTINEVREAAGDRPLPVGGDVPFILSGKLGITVGQITEEGIKGEAAGQTPAEQVDAQGNPIAGAPGPGQEEEEDVLGSPADTNAEPGEGDPSGGNVSAAKVQNLNKLAGAELRPAPTAKAVRMARAERNKTLKHMKGTITAKSEALRLRAMKGLGHKHE